MVLACSNSFCQISGVCQVGPCLGQRFQLSDEISKGHCGGSLVKLTVGQPLYPQTNPPSTQLFSIKASSLIPSEQVFCTGGRVLFGPVFQGLCTRKPAQGFHTTSASTNKTSPDNGDTDQCSTPVKSLAFCALCNSDQPPQGLVIRSGQHPRIALEHSVLRMLESPSTSARAFREHQKPSINCTFGGYELHLSCISLRLSTCANSSTAGNGQRK